MASTAVSRLFAEVSEKCAYLESLRDPRTFGWSFTSDPKYIFSVCLGYLYLVKIAGPRWMTNRKPYNLKSVIMVYNLFQVISNAFFFVQYMRHTYMGGNYSVFCQGTHYSPTDQNEIRVLEISWWYLFVRIADLMDTVFFVATKKFSHVTYLHVVHHFLVVINGWVYLNFGGGGQLIMVLCLNSLVHVVMYGYYFLSALGPRIQKYLWWKRYLTRLQIFQIAFLTLHACIPLVYDCGYPKALVLLALPQSFVVFGLFINFYIKSYTKTEKPGLCITQVQKDE
ncbi:elongation of very long chain fatty acids protein AAEL008004-like [Ixodes scapularis]|uniref:elongation of very long chain fatty acids protein AAEL008004-like n=1 Tax=Ixodes scapularis TaxID=6945 RepID=UPI001A9EC534|nr:elongation of very long chain fatty acids protein AAEL008004-like [Ixodes scapularis]